MKDFFNFLLGFVTTMSLAFVAMTACDLPATIAPAAEVTTCALSDDKLSIAFRNPAEARVYLKDLGKRLKSKDDDAVREAADLIARFVECLPE